MRHRNYLTLSLLTLLPINLSAQEQGGDQAKQQRMELMVRSVSDVNIRTADDRELALRQEPLLRWSNPVSGIIDGTVFMWTLDGRPQAAAQVFRVPDGTWLQEFQSLALDGLTSTRGADELWSPTQPGIEMQTLPNAPRPADTATRRLVQMRGLLRQFSASDRFEDREPYRLRLLTSPLHRYGQDHEQIFDGALFAFTHGTDPEVLVLIETAPGSDAAWKVGFAPLTSYAVEVKRGDELFWKCDRRPPPNKTSDSFFLHVYGR